MSAFFIFEDEVVAIPEIELFAEVAHIYKIWTTAVEYSIEGNLDGSFTKSLLELEKSKDILYDLKLVSILHRAYIEMYRVLKGITT